MKSLILGTSAVLLALTVSAAHAEIKPITFTTNDSTGVLTQVRVAYGLDPMEHIEVGFVDIDYNGVSEVAVKFSERCSQGKCPYTLLMAVEGQTFELFSEPASEFNVDIPDNADTYVRLITDGIVWEWEDNAFVGRADKSSAEKLTQEALASAPPAFLSYDLGKYNIQEPAFYEVDLEGDGRKELLAVESNMFNCMRAAECAHVIISGDGEEIITFMGITGEIYSQNNNGNNRLIVELVEGDMIFAKSGNTYEEIGQGRVMSVRGL